MIVSVLFRAPDVVEPLELLGVTGPPATLKDLFVGEVVAGKGVLSRRMALARWKEAAVKGVYPFLALLDNVRCSGQPAPVTVKKRFRSYISTRFLRLPPSGSSARTITCEPVPLGENSV